MLAEIGANDIPMLLVMNKIDLLDDFAPHIDRDEENRPLRVWLSTHSGEEVALLMQALTELMAHALALHKLGLPQQTCRLWQLFYQLQAIEKEWVEEDGSVGLMVRLPVIDWYRLCKQEMALVDYLV